MPASKTSEVKIGSASKKYPIYFCDRGDVGELRKIFRSLELQKRRSCVLIDEGFTSARGDFLQSLKELLPVEQNLFITVPAGEAAKSWNYAGQVLGQMIRAGLSRNDFCVAVGGGVVGDLGGFVASLFGRGIDVIHVPTTLLAMVDSSIGGKTAVNHDDGKNLIGTFHQPKAVIQTLSFLKTLSQSDYLSGLGEVFKYAVGFDRGLFRFLDTHASGVLSRDFRVLRRILADCVAIKAKIVAADERESGAPRSPKLDRRLLNLGHTFGHAFEKAYGLQHGVAVAAGVTLSARFSWQVKLCPQRCYDEVMGLAANLQLKSADQLSWKWREVERYIKRDKKVSGDQVQFVGLRNVGSAVIRPTLISDLRKLEG